MPDPSDNEAPARPPFVLVVAAALIDDNGRVLLTQRAAGKALAGAWEFPGGKVEGGETPEAALVRELKEELAIDVELSALEPFTFASHAYEELQLLMPLYLCRTWQGAPAASEGQALKWVRPIEMRGLHMPLADLPLVERLISWGV